VTQKAKQLGRRAIGTMAKELLNDVKHFFSNMYEHYATHDTSNPLQHIPRMFLFPNVGTILRKNKRRLAKLIVTKNPCMYRLSVGELKINKEGEAYTRVRNDFHETLKGKGSAMISTAVGGATISSLSGWSVGADSFQECSVNKLYGKPYVLTIPFRLRHGLKAESVSTDVMANSYGQALYYFIKHVQSKIKPSSNLDKIKGVTGPHTSIVEDAVKGAVKSQAMNLVKGDDVSMPTLSGIGDDIEKAYAGKSDFTSIFKLVSGALKTMFDGPLDLTQIRKFEFLYDGGYQEEYVSAVCTKIQEKLRAAGMQQEVSWTSTASIYWKHLAAIRPNHDGVQDDDDSPELDDIDEALLSQG
jgi:hypothetical protein